MGEAMVGDCVGLVTDDIDTRAGTVVVVAMGVVVVCVVGSARVGVDGGVFIIVGEEKRIADNEAVRVRLSS